MKTKKLGRGAKISLPLLFLLLAALLVAALSGVFGAPGGASAGEASSEAAVSEALPADGDPEGVLILWAIDVGQGDGLLLRMPTGEHVLVDSGVNTDKNAVPDFLREKGVEEIEYAVFTHPHADHIGAAAEVVRGFRVKNVYMPDVAHTSKTYLDLLDALEADESVSVRRAVAGESFSIGEVTFDILSPIEDKYSDLNLYSAVLRVTYREKRFLLMGDAEQPNETALLASGESLRADLLKVGHHGSSTSSSADFLRAVRPDCALISCGEGNSYGHPEQVVLDRAVCDGKTSEITTERTSERKPGIGKQQKQSGRGNRRGRFFCTLRAQGRQLAQQRGVNHHRQRAAERGGRAADSGGFQRVRRDAGGAQQHRQQGVDRRGGEENARFGLEHEQRERKCAARKQQRQPRARQQRAASRQQKGEQVAPKDRQPGQGRDRGGVVALLAAFEKFAPLRPEDKAEQEMLGGQRRRQYDEQKRHPRAPPFPVFFLTAIPARPNGIVSVYFSITGVSAFISRIAK